jgi:hypothetical protein
MRAAAIVQASGRVAALPIFDLRIFRMLAQLPHDHPGRKADAHHGLWNGPCHQRLGHSRARQYEILTTAGGLIYTNESPEGIKVGDRLMYETGFDALGIECLAINVRAAEPVEAIKDSKIAKRK